MRTKSSLRHILPPDYTPVSEYVRLYPPLAEDVTIIGRLFEYPNMEKVAIDDVRNEVNPLQVHDTRRPVSDALGTDHFAMNYFELEPGDSFSGGLHRHNDQEEVFYIEQGTAIFEVGRERETVTVEAGEVIRFEPGEFQMGSASEESNGPVIGWALGAPGASHDWDDLESVIPCQTCGEERVHETSLTEEGRFEFVCTECGNEFSM